MSKVRQPSRRESTQTSQKSRKNDAEVPLFLQMGYDHVVRRMTTFRAMLTLKGKAQNWYIWGSKVETHEPPVNWVDTTWKKMPPLGPAKLSQRGGAITP